MSRWWRAYDEAVDDPKLQLLSDSMFRAWFNIQCIASKNGGKLPAVASVAFTLRVKPEKASEIITRLCVAGLLDKTDDGFEPHNWTGRQYKTDAADPTAPERMKRYRDRKRNDRNATVTDTVTQPVTVKLPETEQRQNDDEGRTTRAGTSMISAEAFEIADALEKACGYDLPEEIPPGWCGGAMWVQKCLNEGWIGAVMIDATKTVARRAKSSIMGFKYLERPLAEAMAAHNAPLPKVEVRQPEKLTVIANGKPQGGNVIQAIDRLADTLRSFDAGPDGADEIRSGASPSAPRLLSQG
jgi:hypothetical protein